MELKIFRHTAHTPYEYAEAEQLQRMRAHSISEEGAPGLAILFECAPVITLGRRLHDPQVLAKHLLWEHSAYAQQGVALHRVGRGGFATYHGPGQWVLFFTESLQRLTGDPRGVRRAVDGLLEGTRQFAQSLLPSQDVRTCHGGELGVWSSRGKLAALGLEFERGILRHGVALNFYRAGAPFPGIKPCGLELGPADLLAQWPGDVEFVHLGVKWAQSVAAQFEVDLKTAGT